MAAACSSSNGSPGVTITNNGCALPPSGVFLVHFVPDAGNTCGPIADALIDGSDLTSASTCPGGSGTITDNPVSGGGCSVVVDAKGCQVANGMSTAMGDTIEKVTWSSDYSSATGIDSLTLSSGSQQCSGTYMVTFTKQ